jgi:hypothetical protein
MATVNYSVNTTTNDDWSGVITVGSLTSIVFSEAGTPTNITAVGGFSFVPDNISYYNPGYVTWRSDTDQNQYPNSGIGFDVWSLDMYDDIVGGFTWNNLISTGTYNLTADKNIVFYNYNIPTAIYWGIGGTITFSI